MATRRYTDLLPAGFLAEGDNNQIVKATPEEYAAAKAAGAPPTPDQITSSRKSAVTDLVNQGMTDPNKILNALNYLDSGEKVGDFTLDEVTNFSGKGQRYTGAPEAPKTDPVADYFSKIKDQATMPDEARRAALRSQAEQDVQTQIAAINNAYNTLIADERGRQEKAAQLGARQVSGIGRLAGLGGSSIQSGRQGEQMSRAQEAERAAVQALQAKQAADAAAIRGKGLAEADARFQQEQQLAQQAQGQYAQYLQSLASAAREANKPMEVGGYLVDPTTGKVIFASPEKKAAEAAAKSYTLSPGQKVYDAQGNIIAQNNAADSTKPIAVGKDQVLVDPTTGKVIFQRDKSDITNAADLSPEDKQFALKLAQDFDDASKSFVTQAAAKSRIDAVTQNPSAGGDIALIFSFMKLLDPTSVVREGEFATAANAGSIPERVKSQYNAALSGEKLSDAIRQDFVGQAQKIYNSAKSQQDKVSAIYTQRANAYGVPVDLVVRNLDAIAAPAPADSSAAIGEAINSYSPQEVIKALSSKPGATGTLIDVSRALGISDEIYKQQVQALGGNPDEVWKWLKSRLGNSLPKVDGGTGAAQNHLPMSVSIPKSSRLASVNNNPGNLRYAGQAGASQGEGGFARFSTPQAGYAALHNQIALDGSRGLTLGQFISKYAPPTENNTSLYLQQITARVGASASTPLNQINREQLARAIAAKESGTQIS